MTKFLFCNDPHAGHVNPTLPVVHELVSRGAQVSYYCSESFRAAIEATGASFHPYIFWKTVSSQERKHDFSENPLVNNAHFIIEQVLEDARAERADVLVYEAMNLWGKVLARALRLPAVSLHTTLATNKYFHPFDTYTRTVEPQPFSLKMREAVRRLAVTYGIAPFEYETFFFHDERLNIVFLPSEFHPAVATFSPRFLFVGPTIIPEQEAKDSSLNLEREQRVIYVSLGTVENNFPAFYDLCIHAFGAARQRLVMAIGDRIDAAVFGELPANVTLYKYAPQLAILPYTDVFLNHSGANSVMEALYYGVPALMLPITLEQKILANRTQELKLGRAIENMKLVTAHGLRTMVRDLQADSEMRASIQRMRAILHSSGSYKQAAEALLQLS